MNDFSDLWDFQGFVWNIVRRNDTRIDIGNEGVMFKVEHLMKLTNDLFSFSCPIESN